MGKGDPCEICGGTESNLVDGFYYCTECGTQDTNVRETLVEHTMLGDGTFGVARRQKISKKLKEGVKMSKEWYKWHTLNFILAGLTEQLVQLGAAPSLKMKVLWIWTRYIKKFQKKDEMRQTQMFSQLQVSSESENEKSEGSAAGEQEAAARAPLRRVTRYLLAALLALALNLDRSPLQLSHFLRLILHRLLALNDFQRFVPAEIDPRDVPGFELLRNTPLSACSALPGTMGRVARELGLGPPLTPDVEAVLRDQLRDLALPPGLGRLARALMDRAPVPFQNAIYLRTFRSQNYRHPDYEAVVMAYVLVALKMCFGLDDDLERRLSAAVDRLNDDDNRLRAYADVPGDTDRLFSPREWLEHLHFRKAALGAHYAPLARERNVRADDYVFVEHFDEHAYSGRAGRRQRAACPVGDRLTMDILDRIPAGAAPAVAPLHALKPCMAARAPHAALAAAVAAHAHDARTRRRLLEDFTRYSAEYASGAHALPGAAPDLFAGVAGAGKTLPEPPARSYAGARSDPTIVHVRNCENKNWFKTRRPTASHVITADEAADDRGPGPEPAAEPGPAERPPRDRELETFEEETEGGNIFDDDFRDVDVKEEIKIECDPESFHETRDDLESHGDFGNLDSFHENVDRAGREESDAGARGLVFDSDEEGPRYDPAAFDRYETIKKIMIEAYREFKICNPPVRFAPDRDKPEPRARKKREGGDVAQAPRGRAADPARAAARRRNQARVRELLASYFHNLRHDVLHQVAQQVRSFVANVEDDPIMEFNDTASNRDPADAAVAERDGSASGGRDVELVEDHLNEINDDDDSAAGPAEDPLYEGDVRFDENAHDTRQLYVRLRDGPAVERAPPDDSDEDVSKLLDEKIANPVPARKAGTTRKQKINLLNIDHLVDDPASITRFNYWFTHYTYNFRKGVSDSDNVQASFDETLPRSFRFVLREAAALLRARPALLYRYLVDVEDQLFASMAGGALHTPHHPTSDNNNKGKKRARRKSEYSKNKLINDTDAENRPPKKRKQRAPRRADTLEAERVDDKETDDVDDDVASAVVFF